MTESSELVKNAGEAIWQTLYADIMEIRDEIMYSPINILLLAVAILVAYKIVRHRFAAAKPNGGDYQSPDLPNLRRDFTNTEELRDYDGNGQDGRILIAVNGNVYDVTKERRFFGSGGLCSSLAGKHATRNLIAISAEMEQKHEPIDVMSLLEMELINGWELEFKNNFDQVGKLLRGVHGEDDADRNTARPIASKIGADILKKRSNI